MFVQKPNRRGRNKEKTMRFLLNIAAWICYPVAFLAYIADGKSGVHQSDIIWNVPMLMIVFAVIVHWRAWLMIVFGFFTARWLRKMLGGA